ncbi:CGNR zinc finger domain-containing protein [Nocardia yamanashiensis]|uniref:CGNR zinc finger domain-containing protein n=1 Tax=Nocardia yamanashiensis TaxID=209247 RepID=UPI00082A1619|nr:ABATE domain-containing protein [Nocardia yamanashiensis]
MTRPDRLGLALVATRRRRRTDSPIDDLTDPTTLCAWLQARGLEVGECSPGDLTAICELREAIYDSVAAAATDGHPTPSALDILNAVASHPMTERKLLWDTNSGFHLETGPHTLTQALITIARDTVDLLTGPVRDQLRQCEADSCGTVFIAPASGRPRRWCSSATCGNRERVRAHRAGS